MIIVLLIQIMAGCNRAILEMRVVDRRKNIAQSCSRLVKVIDKMQIPGWIG